MIQTPTPKPLNGPLRAVLLAQVQTSRDGGATFDQLAALVGRLEAGPP